MYLITGGTGFVGTYVTRRLLQRGEPVCLYEIAPDTTLLAALWRRSLPDSLRIITGDVSRTAPLFAAIAELRPRMIIHLASPLPPKSEDNAPDSLATITQSHLNVFEAARLFGTERIVWASAASVFGSAAQHGGVDAAVADDAPHYPNSIYGICKSTNERLSRFYYDRYRLQSIGFRFMQGYGPGKSRGRPFGYRMFESLLRNEPFTLPFGDDVINWQYVEDIADIIVRGLDTPVAEGTVANTTGEVLSARETLTLLQELVPGAQVSFANGSAEIVWRLRTKFVESVLGFDRPTPARDGFARTLETMRQWHRVDP